MMNEPTHTVTRYDQELERPRGIVARMGGLVERQTAQAIAAVVDQNEEAAREPPRLDAEVDMPNARPSSLPSVFLPCVRPWRWTRARSLPC